MCIKILNIYTDIYFYYFYSDLCFLWMLFCNYDIFIYIVRLYINSILKYSCTIPSRSTYKYIIALYNYLLLIITIFLLLIYVYKCF